MINEERARWFFNLHVKRIFVPGTACHERWIDVRELLYDATLAIHYGNHVAAIELIGAAADGAFLLRAFSYEDDLRRYVDSLRKETFSG